ncbi:MAG TPA: hypothetical protein DIW30_00815 [Bacteroidales bacterium]|nr:hypothetical protein [Bacteroidales bacterium]
MKRQSYYGLVFAIAFLICSCNNKEVNFSYSPASPRAGQKVTFSNLTEEGETWAWNFGDGSQSTLKNPTKTYKKPGTYIITLTADSSKHRMCSKEITVFDTIPTFSLSTDSIVYREEVELKAVVYNPYNKSVSYKWNLPECAVLTKGITSDESIRIYFSKKDTTVQVELTVTLDQKDFDIKRSLYIHNGTAISLLMVTDNGLLRQRIFANGAETPTLLPIDADKTASVGTLIIHQDWLYLLQSKDDTESAIYKRNLQTQQMKTLVKNSSATTGNGFYAGCIDKQYLYWGSLSTLHRISLSEEDALLNAPTDYQIAQVSDIPSMEEGTSTGIGIIGSTLFWSTGKGIYHFDSNRMLLATLLAEKDIQHFTIDIVARKIYAVTENTLFVCNLDGGYLRELSRDATGALTVNYATNRLYYTTSKGVAYLPLVQTQNNQTIAEPAMLNDITDVSALVIDDVKRQ